MNPGDIYIGKSLNSYEPQLWFYYVLLSHDKEADGKEYWTAAKFTKGQHGAQVEKFTGGEISQLGYVGHILSVLTSSSDGVRVLF